jgi:hypothetical protein
MKELMLSKQILRGPPAHGSMDVNRQRLPGRAFGRIHRKPEAHLIRCCRRAVMVT